MERTFGLAVALIAFCAPAFGGFNFSLAPATHHLTGSALPADLALDVMVEWDGTGDHTLGGVTLAIDYSSFGTLADLVDAEVPVQPGNPLGYDTPVEYNSGAEKVFATSIMNNVTVGDGSGPVSAALTTLNLQMPEGLVGPEYTIGLSGGRNATRHWNMPVRRHLK